MFFSRLLKLRQVYQTFWTALDAVGPFFSYQSLRRNPLGEQNLLGMRNSFFLRYLASPFRYDISQYFLGASTILYILLGFPSKNDIKMTKT